MNNHPILWQLHRVCKAGIARPRLAEISLVVTPGITAVIGASGAGKSTLLNLLVGFEKPDRGRIENKIDDHRFQLPLYWVPQNGGLWPRHTVAEHLRLPGYTDRKKMNLVLEGLEIADKTACYPATLSPGEQSRVSIARALLLNPAVLVMDEPLVNIDQAGRNQYWQMVINWVNENGNSLVFASHAPEYVIGTAEQVLCLRAGAVIYYGTVAELYWRPPAPEPARCLGETNWLEPEDAMVWLREKVAAPFSLRPEQLSIKSSPTSSLVLCRHTFRGAYAEVVIESRPRTQQRRFICRSVPPGIKAGDRVEVVRTGIGETGL